MYRIRRHVYNRLVPKIWTDTIEAHRRAVQEAAIDATAQLVAERGLLSVTMSQIAEEAGIGRATLYKYFPDVEAVLKAWHERQIIIHLDQLAQARDRASGPRKRLEAVLQAYAQIAHESHRHHGTEIAALLHRGDHVVRAQQHLHAMIRDLVAEAAQSGDLRDDIAPDELATFCLHALAAASGLPSKAAVVRLVNVTLAGLQFPR
jgi:AcrR family transcriptional regulator